ncbi:MAG: hypothetical protein U0269_12820 [Polyangiales bacterium]
MNKHTVISLAIASLLSACNGSSQSSSTTTSTTTQASAGAEHAEHHPQLTAAQHSMHEVLAPIWHSEAGPARTARACEQAATLRERAAGVQSEAAPAGAPANTAELRAALVTAADALVTECAGSRAAVDAKLADLHTAFHHVFEAR